MKKKVFLMALVGAALTACSNHDDVFTGKTEQEAQYEQNFVKKFGQPDPNHTWGFGNYGDSKSAVKTRAMWADANMWCNDLVIPEPITKREQEVVYKTFLEYKGEGLPGIDLQDFFVQQVYKGTSENEKYTAADNSTTCYGGACMNQLFIGDEQHIYDFNNTYDCTFEEGYTKNVTPEGNWQGDCGTAKSHGQIMFFRGSSTSRFGFSSDKDSGKSFYNYKLLQIDVDGVIGYYVGLDFEAKGGNLNEQFAADGVYTDWIIKVVPGSYIKNNSGRIICEDLGNTDDFDFNDVVLSVNYPQEWNAWYTPENAKTIITLEAAGGTMPATVKAGDLTFEVHEAFGVSTKTMVNTKTNGAVEKPVRQFTINKIVKPEEIEITIENTNNSQVYTLKAECGKAPQKIYVPMRYKITNERESIEAKYPKFKDWVGNTEIEWID